MFFDIKLNTMQRTKGWLKRKVKNFEAYNDYLDGDASS